MTQTLLDTLTPRQLDVLERIDRRASYKEIAHELEISESRVSQYAALLKNRFGVNSLGELTEAFRACQEASLPPCNFDPSQKPHLPLGSERSQQGNGAESLCYEFADSLDPDWASQFEHRIVPGALDGKSGTLLRIGLVTLVAILFLAAIVLGLAAMDTLSEFMDRAS